VFLTANWEKQADALEAVIVAGKQSQANKNYWVGVCHLESKSRRGTRSQAGGRKSTARGTPQSAEAINCKCETYC